jgi:DNA-binding transcriptional regulator GbsR (MarR family)
MTETSKQPDELPPAVKHFVLKWGDMGSAWGVNRSVSQIHALLYLSDQPLTAEDIADKLGMARSNVSNSLKELMSWSLIRRAPQLRDRRDHFEAEGDIWEIVTRIAVQRKAREIDPILATLQTCLDEAERDARVTPVVKERIGGMLEFTNAANRWFDQMIALPRGKLKMLLKLGAKVANLLPQGRKAERE